MLKFSIFVLFSLGCSCIAQKQYTTPVPILKQINRHNEDGSYSYGYEAADGSFKIETKSATGEVKGKYGYVDDSGNLREVAYGANQNGFHPSGDGISVAPAAPHSDSQYPPLQPGEIDDGQYREDPAIYNDPRYHSKPSKSSQFRVNASPAPARPSQTYSYSSQPAQQAAPAVPYRSQFQQQQPQYEQPITQTQRPYYQTRFSAPVAAAPIAPAPVAPAQNYYQPQPNYYNPPSNNNYYQQSNNNVDIFRGHPATNLDLATGSYSVTYG
ncbi:CLUMA_CG001826, isoform A [Clunio marinus]|uniref:CLUMA_CG001826, isoform A n=1 Tax=Clunio marinus TaxID=568069 RepID=A0A1J1HJ15_9DIPT|nr:CLUMA_CG001826, isoform A [Clunio marinus]